MSQKLDKELKAPDHFVSFWASVAHTLKERRRQVLGVGLAIVVGGGAIWGIQGVVQGRKERTSAAFARIHRIANAPLLPEGNAPAPSDDLPHFKTDRERLEAAVKEADSFLAAHGGSSVNEEAQVLKARYLVSLGRAAEALPLYEGLVGSLDSRLRFLAKDGLAFAYEETGQIDKAVSTLDALASEAKEDGNFFRDRALFNKARLLERKGDGKEAQKIYKEVLAESPTTALKDEINNRLAVLEGK